ncbi:MAG TPA: Ig-like domain-containing protein, partial [Gemmatimonadaceae bacterium]|nr:Ig-like domain-containing protein [Gemmatimonadaceae bacterium]
MLRVARTMAAFTAIVLLLACGGDSTAPPEDGLASVDVQPRDATLRLFALWPHMHQTALSRAGLEIKTNGVWSSSNASIVSVDAGTGAMTGVAVGSATVTDDVTLGGVTKSATSQVVVTEASAAGAVTATTSAAFTPQLMTITRGGGTGTVTWTFQAEPHTVTWDSQPPGA